jgi:glutamate-1-semialdehyde 2,1-aminomutase
MKNNIYYSKKINSLIPGGAHTYSRGDDQFPINAPSILDRGKGPYVWSFDNKKYLDYGMGLRSVTLGYANKEINDSVFKEIKKGNNLTRASLTELEAAETLMDIMPNADMVKFAKNGSNVTTAAIKLARAYTKKRYVFVPKEHPFFSFDDWFIGSTMIKKGIPKDYHKYTKTFNYGDINSLVKLFKEHKDDVAAVILEPSTTLTPCQLECHNRLKYNKNCNCGKLNFLQYVEKITKENKALFILDEMITGFRFHLKGAQNYFNVSPDLSTFGKGMANGFSVAALTGRREIMSLGGIKELNSERTFLLSSTHGAEMVSLRALISTIKFYKRNNVCKHLWEYGLSLKTIFEKEIINNDLSGYIELEGLPVLMNYKTLNSEKKICLKMRTLFNQEMIKNNVLMPWISPSFSHGKRELSITQKALSKTLKIYRKALNDGVENYLVGPSIKPVFRKFN